MRPRVFLDFSLDNVSLGRVILELYTESAPQTAENFRALCTGEKGLSSAGVPLYYKNSIVHRCIKDFMIQGGDFTKRNGTGGESIFGGNFPDEDLSRPLDAEGLLCMANRGPNTNGSQFFITLRECPHLNGKHVVFGKVIRGYDDVISKIANVPVDGKDRPTTSVIISNCGELELRKKEPVKRDRSPEDVDDNIRRSRHSSLSRSRSSSLDSAPRRKKSKKEKKKSKKEKAMDNSHDEDVPRRPNGETEEEYDARLEREENERIESQRRKELERLKRLNDESIQSKDGVRFKGRGRMKYIDPETSRRY
ncbi:hypothetical protein BDZ89DRAFT_1092739 [Hymenopellis radicata]|nr:hypothetical protein BDZ89DRAFT_1092739 [Hymenopellis radicata]